MCQLASDQTAARVVSSQQARPRLLAITDSWTSRGWRGPLETIWSNPAAEAGSPATRATEAVRIQTAGKERV